MKSWVRNLVLLAAVIFLASCQSNEEKIITEYLTTLVNEDGSTTKIEIGKYKFHSFEEIAVDGKFVYSLMDDDENAANKDSVLSEIKRNLEWKNKCTLRSAIFFKRALETNQYEWSKEREYKKKSEEESEESYEYLVKAVRLGKIYNNYDDTTFYLIKASYDYTLEKLESKNIVNYFIFNKEENKIVGSFSKLDDSFIKYYFNSVSGIEVDEYDEKKYDYGELLDKPLDELIEMLDI